MTTVKNQKQDEASTQSLDVYLHGERIGIITRGQDPEGPSFQYLESYRTRSGAIALGRQIPLTEEPTRSETILRWIDGLLPEGDRRGDLTRQLGLHRMSTWSLIREIGLDCAGAVQVADPHHRTGRPSYYKASEAEIGLAFDQIAQRPIQTFERGARLSIAGAQEKIVLAKLAEHSWAWPLHGAPSTHILKPQTARFPGLVQNECLCMTVAARARLPTAKVQVRHFGRHETLVVERFDRSPQGNRIHQEDFAQALGTVAKYQQPQGPTLRDCFTRTGVGGWPLWEQVMFAWLIGDEDKHAKNFSVLYESNKPPRLTPIYDAVCTLAYPNLQRGMAMRIGRTYQVREVDEHALQNEASKCGLDPIEAIERTHTLSERVHDAIQTLREEGWNTSILENSGTLDRCEKACEWAKT